MLDSVLSFHSAAQLVSKDLATSRTLFGGGRQGEEGEKSPDCRGEVVNQAVDSLWLQALLRHCTCVKRCATCVYDD